MHRLIAFDLDGTLVEGLEFSWQHIHDHLGTDKTKRDAMREKFFSKEISYAEWARHDILLWKEKGATEKDLINALGNLRVMPGATETIKALKEQGLKVGVISGSLSFVLDHLFPGHIFDFVYLNKITFKDGKIDKIYPTPYDFAHKADALRLEAKKHKISLQDCVFVGDHLNDVEIAKIAGLSFAFNCRSKELKDTATYCIIEKDLRKILPLIR
jgi:phosphoserine phosphatase